jgi:phage terminase large subunit-like protein
MARTRDQAEAYRKELRAARKAKNRADHLEGMHQKQAGKRAMRGLNAYVEQQNGAPGRMEIPDPRLMNDQDLVALVAALMNVDKYDWHATARPEQLEPDDYAIWLLMAGRGFGKTRCSAEAVREACEKPGTRAAVIAKDHRALRDVCFEGVSGLLACIPPDAYNPKDYNKGLGDVGLKLKNGSSIKGYTAGEPDAIRGQSFDIIWGDEFAAWPRNKAEDMLAQARMCLRESDAARAILSTTPKRVPHVVAMINLAKDPDERVVVTTGRSRDNTALSEDWHKQMERTYGGTSLGRQELEGELVMDNEFALWQSRWIEEARWVPVYNEKTDKYNEMPAMMGVVVGVDPSGSKDGDATGISTVGWDRDKTLWVLDNRTCNGTPAERYTQVCLTAVEHGACEIVYETSYGGDNCAFGITQQWKNLIQEGVIDVDRRCPPIVGSKIKGDKAARAMPVVVLYEQQVNIPERRRIYHVAATPTNQLAKLEEEMLTWETNSTKSPNAIDACVHACRKVLQKTGQEVVISRPVSPHSTRRVGGGYSPYGR